ncbi:MULTISPECIES: hypothetical protein [Candidatus Ichthyocystis]|uniref:hypothetical protein n=1 Tax=Candidatus Ichthyocystis TaxID=2929841 RepID=UPI00155ECD98|nr:MULTISPECIES: hypothetical protein [Ichthyocystis]
MAIGNYLSRLNTHTHIPALFLESIPIRTAMDAARYLLNKSVHVRKNRGDNN